MFHIISTVFFSFLFRFCDPVSLTQVRRMMSDKSRRRKSVKTVTIGDEVGSQLKRQCHESREHFKKSFHNYLGRLSCTVELFIDSFSVINFKYMYKKID